MTLSNKIIILLVFCINKTAPYHREFVNFVKSQNFAWVNMKLWSAWMGLPEAI